MTERIRFCKYCGERIPRGEVWNPDQNGNGYHHACLINMQLEEEAKRAKRLAQNSILDKVRTEIEEIATYDGIYIDRAYVLEILDKYRAESEE